MTNEPLKGVDISKMFDNEDSNWINEYIDLCAQKSGYSDYQKLPDFKTSNDGVEYFKSVGSFKDASYTPVVGDNYVIECDESLGKVGDRIVFTTEDGKEMGAKALFKTPLFFLGIILMICGSARISG